jgi:hypothetical protein
VLLGGLKRVFPGDFFLGVRFLQFDPLALITDVTLVHKSTLLEHFVLAPAFSLVPLELWK